MSAMDEAVRWAAQAERDLEVADHSLAEAPYMRCFACQQAAEKMLKALLYAAGKEVSRTHSVTELVALVRVIYPHVDLGRVERLDRFYIPTRYPDAWPGGIPADMYTDEDGREALQLAQQSIEAGKLVLASIKRELES